MNTLKVLVCDDELGMRHGAAKVLKNFTILLAHVEEPIGFVPVEAADGNEAMHHLQNDTFDLVLLDYKMPGPSGLEILEFIKQSKIDVITVMVTAYASLEVAISATKNGAFDFLAKPFTPEELKSVVEKAAGSLLAHREAKRLAEEKRHVRFQFISVLAHELKAPLAAIESYLQLMHRHTAGEAISDYDHIVNRSLIRIDGMRKMIFDLLDLTRIESGQKKRELVDLDITEIIKTSVETLAVVASERKITIQFDTTKPVKMYADKNEIEIICNNLISNAVKYNRDNGKVEISLFKFSDEITMKVADTGFGMTAEEQDRLFGEFVRIKNENTRNIMGSGLGLSIVKKLATLYKGDVTVESENEKGSIFTIRLKDMTPPVDNLDFSEK